MTLVEQFKELMMMFVPSDATCRTHRAAHAFESEKAMIARLREADEDIARLRGLEK